MHEATSATSSTVATAQRPNYYDRRSRVERGSRETAEPVGLGAGRPGAAPSARFHRPTETMGGREDLLVAGTEPPHEHGLRTSAGELGNVRLRRDESPYGEAVGPSMRLFRQFLRNCLKRGSSGAPSADLVGIPGHNRPN